MNKILLTASALIAFVLAPTTIAARAQQSHDSDNANQVNADATNLDAGNVAMKPTNSRFQGDGGSGGIASMAQKATHFVAKSVALMADAAHDAVASLVSIVGAPGPSRLAVAPA